MVLCGLTPGLRAEGFEILFSTGGADRRVLAPPSFPPAPPTGEFVVARPVVDLRRNPVSVTDGADIRRPYAVDPLQESQVLYGEAVQSFEEKEGGSGWRRPSSRNTPTAIAGRVTPGGCSGRRWNRAPPSTNPTGL